MRFMMIYKPADLSGLEGGVPPSQQEMAQMGAFIDELAQAGVLLATDGLMGSAAGARVKQADGKVTVTDGPFTEAKELIGGFALLEVKSKEEALELARRFVAIAGDGTSEIRALANPTSR